MKKHELEIQVEIREWLEQNYPNNLDYNSDGILNLIIKNKSK